MVLSGGCGLRCMARRLRGCGPHGGSTSWKTQRTASHGFRETSPTSSLRTSGHVHHERRVLWSASGDLCGRFSMSSARATRPNPFECSGSCWKTCPSHECTRSLACPHPWCWRSAPMKRVSCCRSRAAGTASASCCAIPGRTSSRAASGPPNPPSWWLSPCSSTRTLACSMLRALRRTPGGFCMCKAQRRRGVWWLGSRSSHSWPAWLWGPSRH
mmetsp:Transcript_15597/g.46084  ORF Transcript_15597/g.46084 Transcript_15597/m.46084 type:complete len:214 (+) Transcript_15597:20-661(+)